MQLHKNNWLDIFTGFRVALSMKKMLLGAACLYVTILIILGTLFIASKWYPEAQLHLDALLDNPVKAAPALASDISENVSGLAARKGFNPDGSFAFRPIGLALGTGALLLLVWSFFCGPIMRIAAVEFTTDNNLPLNEGFKFANKRLGSFFWSPIAPLIFVLLLLLGATLVGLLGRVPVVGAPLMGLFSVLAIFFSAIALILLIATIFGCAFMWPTIAVEGTNSFDAVSRSFNYILTRPWKTLWCWLVAAVYGAIAIAFIGAFAWVMLKLAFVCLGIGMGAENFAAINSYLTQMRIAPDTPTQIVIAGFFLKVVFILVAGLVCGFVVSYDCTACTIIYCVIRRDIDGTGMDEIFLPEPEEEPAPQPVQAEENTNASPDN